MSDQSKKDSRPPRPQQDEKTRGRGDRPSRPGKPAGAGADKAERRRPGKDKTGGRSDQGSHGDTAGNGRSRGGRPAGPEKGGTSRGAGADKKRAERPAPGGKPGEAGRDGRGRPGHKGPDDNRSGGRGAARPSGKSRQEHTPGRGLRDAREIRAPRRDGAYGTAWQGAEALFPPLMEEARHILEQLPQALSRVWPLSKAHRRTLPDDVARLSRLLTTERAALDRPYWSSPAFVSAYLYYFLPWNLVRLTRLLSAMPLPDPRHAAPPGGQARLLEGG